MNTLQVSPFQLVSARLSEQEVLGSILGDFNVCFDFRLIRVAIDLIPIKRITDRGMRLKGRTVGFH